MNNSYMCCLKIMLANGKTIMFWQRTYIWLWLFVRDEVYNMSMIKKFCLPVVFLKSHMGLSCILKNPLLYLHQLCGFLLLFFFFFFFSFKSPCSQATRKVRYMEGMVGEGCWGKGRTEDEEYPCASSNWVCCCDEGRDSCITLEPTRSLAALRKAVSLFE